MWKIRGRSGVRRDSWSAAGGVRTCRSGFNPTFASVGKGPATPYSPLTTPYPLIITPYPPLSTAFIDSTACPDASFVGEAFCFCSGVPTTKGMEKVRPTVAPPIVVVTATVM
jgi:hypothetical protein